MTFQLDTTGDVGPMPAGPMNERFLRWSDLSLFAQGYVEALLTPSEALYYSLTDRHAGYDDLAPETLAQIIADCETFLPKLNLPANQQAGAWFWDWRQGAWLEATDEARPDMVAAFPPLTVQLGDDGKVRFA